MQSKLASIARRSKSKWLFSGSDVETILRRGLATSTPYCTQDDPAQQPAVPHGNPEEAETGKADDLNQNHKLPFKSEALKHPHHRSSPTLESTVVHNPADPTFHQKRTIHHPADHLGCEAGLEALPSRDDDDDDRGYYLRHKASPLAEITDGVGSVGPGEVVGWMPEQLETAEETLLRAAEMWRRNAMRGDPDSPHGRVLRALRREFF